MQRWMLFFGLILFFASCKDKTIHCTSIGDQIKPWSVYGLNDTIRMTDGLGNDTSFVISLFNDSQPYTMIERGGFLKKLVTCNHVQHFSDVSKLFQVQIRSAADRGEKNGDVIVKNPYRFDFEINVGDLYGVFSVHLNEVNAGMMNAQTSYEWNYAVGNTTYDEVIVCNQDTTTSAGNTYQFVYAKDKGLVQFSTRFPHKTWTVN